MPRHGLDGRVVVVTGASSGVGRAIAQALGRERAKVGLLARGEDGLLGARHDVEEGGGEAMVLPVDVSHADAVQWAARSVVERWGRIDVWINCAMLSVFSPIAQMEPEEYERVTDVTYLGYVYGTLAALEHMRPRNEGLIVQIGSALAYRSIPLQSAYCAAKSAIRGFTDSLRCELIHDKSRIRVTMLQLPAVNTPQFSVVRSRLPEHPQPVPPIYQPEVIARAVLRAIRRPRREEWIGWNAVKAIVGQKFVPGLLDRYLANAAWDGQQTATLKHRHRDNLDAPLPGDRGAHGEFDSRSRRHSTQQWMSRHRKALAAGAAVALFGLAAASSSG